MGSSRKACISIRCGVLLSWSREAFSMPGSQVRWSVYRARSSLSSFASLTSIAVGLQLRLPLWGISDIAAPHENVAPDPDVWSGRALQENFVELAESGLASMYPASHDGISVKS